MYLILIYMLSGDRHYLKGIYDDNELDLTYYTHSALLLDSYYLAEKYLKIVLQDSHVIDAKIIREEDAETTL